MIEEPPKLTIKKPSRRPTEAQIAAFQDTPTSFVADAMYGSGALAGIRPLGDGSDIPCAAAGPALTVDCGPAEILPLLASTAFIQKGDMVVCASGGWANCAAAGDRVTGLMRNGGAAGFVTDGPMRDYDGLRRIGLPVFCAGLNPSSPTSGAPGRLGLPVQIGGRQVETGDMIVADRDGVVVVPFARIAEVAARLEKIRELEAALDAEVDEGLVTPDAIRELLASDQIAWVE